MTPILDNETYKFYNRDKNPTIWVSVEIHSNSYFLIKTNFESGKIIDTHSLEDYTDYLNLHRIAFDFGCKKCVK